MVYLLVVRFTLNFKFYQALKQTYLALHHLVPEKILRIAFNNLSAWNYSVDDEDIEKEDSDVFEKESRHFLLNQPTLSRLRLFSTVLLDHRVKQVVDELPLFLIIPFIFEFPFIIEIPFIFEILFIFETFCYPNTEN